MSARGQLQRTPGRLRRQARQAKWMTYALLSAMGVVAAGVGALLFGTAGLVVAGTAFGVLAVAGSQVPPRVVMRLNGAVPLGRWSAPGLHDVVDRLAGRAGIPTPDLFFIPSAAPNAMASGGGSARGALAVTDGLLHLVTRDELEAVLAHEVAHLRHRDTAILQLAGVLAQATVTALQVGAWLAFFGLLFLGQSLGLVLGVGLLALVVPPIVRLMLAALSRTRELAADSTAAEISGKPWALASALEKLSSRRAGWLGWVLGPAAEPPWLRSHPPTRERIERLRELYAREPEIIDARGPAPTGRRPRLGPEPGLTPVVLRVPFGLTIGRGGRRTIPWVRGHGSFPVGLRARR